MAEPEIQSHIRKLVTVRRVASTSFLSRTHKVINIDGWKVVVKKTKDFSEGDLVVFLEVDSFLPAGCRFADFSDLFAEVGGMITFDGEEGYRVGMSTWTGRDRKRIISQGHIFHLRDLPHIERKIAELRWERCSTHTDDQFDEFLRMVDFSNALGVKKWENPSDKLSESKTGNSGPSPAAFPKYPKFILKPDMERVQNCPNLFTKPKYCTFLFQESVKMDGTSMTVYFVRSDSPYYAMLPPLPPSDGGDYCLLKHARHRGGRLGVCSRNADLLPHLVDPKATPQQYTYWAAALAASLHTALPQANGSIAVHGELVGASIQGNPYNYPRGHHEFLVFSVFDIERSRRWDPRDVVEFASRIGVGHVPVLGYYTVWSVARGHEDLIARAEQRNGEGLVWKNCADGRWFKVLSGGWVLEREKEKEKEVKEKEVKEREVKEREVKEKEVKEREVKEREVKEREVKEREVKEREGKESGVKDSEVKKSEVKEREVKEKKAKEKKAEENEVKENKVKENEIKGNEVRENEVEKNGAKENEVVVAKGWQMDREDMRILMQIFEDLEEWMRKDDGLKKWMEEWRAGYHRDNGVGVTTGSGMAGILNGGEKKASTDGDGLGDGNDRAYAAEVSDNKKAAAVSADNNNDLLVAKANDSELVEWLGIEGFGL
ncbi:hypothetical protein MFIFM68171_08870 [Madurella fahalii]|uniref:RNA ligase domain-containing protein n=1 Tax=Madurella fahalii TaxID=1157608 RepID=A0ABQ0GM85_9PEZI